MGNPPKVSIIILTTNALEMTKRELLDIARLGTKDVQAECIVVDNGSTDGTEKNLQNYSFPNMDYKFIETHKNLGFAGGNNVGIKDALERGADYVVLMNNDLILPKDIIEKLTYFMEKNPRVGAASPKMYFAKGYEFHRGRYKEDELGKVFWYAGGIIDRKNAYASHRGVDEVDNGQFGKREETDFVNGACVIIRRNVFEKIGYLDESFFLYWEDADFSERARKSGFEITYFPGAYLWHKVSVSVGGSGSPSNDYFLTRNRLYFAMRYLSLRTRLAVLKDTVRLAFIGRVWQRRGATDALLGVRGMGAWAKHK